MPIVSSGQVSVGAIAAEFGGSAPHQLSEYYGKGNCPASGEIQLAADFYGTANTYDIQYLIVGGGGGAAGRGPSGGGDFDGGNGGPGIVVLRVPTSGKPASFAVAPGTNTTFTDGSCTVAVFTVTGTLTL